jgi:hypothetical protein
LKERSEANSVYSTNWTDRSEAKSVYSTKNSKERSEAKSVYSKNRRGANSAYSRNRQDRSEKMNRIEVKLLWSPGIESKELIPPAYALAGLYNNLFQLGS